MNNLLVKHDNKFKRRIFEIVLDVKPGYRLSRTFDITILVCILVSISNIILSTFGTLPTWADISLALVELATTIIFTREYLMRLYSCDYLYAGKYCCILEHRASGHAYWY